jgi:TP901 family phage tail tape measure protein
MSQQKIFFEIEFKGSKELFDQIDLLKLKIKQVNESLKGTSIDGLSSQLKAEFERAKKVVDTFNKVSGGKGSASTSNIPSPINTKPIEVPVKFKLDGEQDIIKQFVEVEQRIKALKDEGKVALKLGDSERLVEIKQEVEGLTIARAKLNKEIKEGAKNNEEFPTGSIQDLTQKVRILAKEYNLLSEEERESTERGKELGKQLGEARVKLNQAKLAVNDYTSNIGNYEGATNNLYLKIKALATATANGNKEVIASLQGDIKAIRIATEKDIDALLKDYQKLSAQEKNSSKGRDKLTLISQAQSQLGGIDKAVGDLDSKVNPLKAKFLSIGDVVTGGLLTGGLTAGILLLATQLQAGTNDVIEYSDSLQNLSAITGVTGKALKELEEEAKKLGTIELDGGSEIKNSAADILEAFKLVGSAAPALLENKEALAAVTKEAIILSKASGEELASSVNTLTTTMAQFNLPASEANKTINQLAAGAKVGAAETRDVAASIKEFGLVAGNSNITVGESVALIETLAEKQLKGSEAGNQLKNILIKLSAPENIPKEALSSFEKLGVSLDVLKDKSIPLEDRLKELSKLQGQSGVLAKAFGTENIQAAQILTESLPKYQNFAKQIEGTNVAYEQAAVNSLSLGDKLKSLSVDFAEIRRVVTEFLINALYPIVTGFTIFLKAIAATPQFVRENKEQFILLGVAIASFNQALIFSTLNTIKDNAIKAYSVIQTNAMTFAQNGLNAAFRANPIGLVITAVALLAAGFITLYKNSENVRYSISGLFSVGKEVLNILVESFKAFGDGFSKLGSGDVKGALGSFKEALVKGNPVGIALTQGERLAKAFGKGYKDQAAKEKLENEKKAEEDAPAKAKAEADAKAKAEAEAKAKADAEAAAKKKAEEEKLAAEKAAKEKAEAKKEREKLDKELEDQYRRLNELRRSIKQLSSENIDNVFDKQIIDATNRTADELAKLEENRKKVQDKIKGQKGKETTLDKEELDFIDKQTELIKSKLDKQTAEINQKRREAFEQQQEQLRKNRDEANKILLNTQVTGLSERLGNIKSGAEDKIQTIKLEYEINKEKLDDQLKAGILSQKEYESEINSLEISSKSDQETIIKERNKRILAIYDEYLLLRKGQIEAERDIAILDLGIEEGKAVESVDEKLKRGEIESVYKANEAKDAIEQLYAQKRISINENAANEINKLNKESSKEKKSLLEDDLKATKETEEAKTKKEEEEEEKRKARRAAVIQALKDAAVDIAQQTSDLLFDNEKSRLDKQKEAGIAALEEEYAKKIEFAQGNTLEIAKLEKERDEKRKKIEKEAFEQNKRVQINQAIANGALAILKAFATLGPFAAAIASIGIAAQTAFQIARIKSTKYERGGLLKGRKHIQGGINLGYGQEGEDGEAIINAESTKKHYELLSAINTDGGNGDPLPGLQSFSNPLYSQRPTIYDRIVPSIPQQYQSNSTVSVSISQRDMDMIAEKVRLGIVEGTKYVETSRSKIESFRKNNSY